MEAGLDFNFSYAAGTTFDQMVAFETAGMMWSDYITDDMTVNIHVEMTNTLPDNVIGGALPGMVSDVNYTNFRNAYRHDMTSWRDRRDFDSLSLVREGTGGIGPGGTWEKFEARIDLGGDYYVEDSAELNMTRANAKALGLVAGNDASLDGYIMMNDLSDSSLNWDYSPGWTSGSSLDFLSTAVHEIGHVLGFVSGVDKYEGVKFDNWDSFWGHFGTFDNFKSYANDVVGYANPLDLFRYSQESLAINNGRNTIDMSIGTQTYFGPGHLWDAYATGKEVSLDGDGFQASHWKQKDDDNGIIGIMDPLMRPGIIRRISDRDLRAMDSIGYNVNRNAENLMANNVIENNWRPSTGGGTGIGDLRWRAKDHLAKSLYSDGQASWFQHWEQHQPWKASEMTSDRTGDIDWMIDKSKVYQARGKKRSSRSRVSRQEIFFAESYFSSVDAQYFDTPAVSNLNLSPIAEFVVQSNWSEAIFQPLETDADILQTDERENQITVSTAEMELISLTEQDTVDTVSTDLHLELVEASLYSNLAEAAVVAIPSA